MKSIFLHLYFVFYFLLYKNYQFVICFFFFFPFLPLKAAVDKLRTEAYEIESAADIKSEQLEVAKLTIHRVFKYLEDISSHQVIFTVDDVVTDDNLLLYLEGLEKRVLDLVECQKFLDRKVCI